MQGFTNSNRKNSAGYEKLIVSLTTNQPTHTDINGVTITLSVDGKVTERQWTGAQLTFMVPQGKQYTISFSNVEGYRTPAQVTRTSSPDNTHSVTATYQSELVEVSVSADNGESVDGQKVTVNNKIYTVSSGKVTTKVPFGTAYTISTDSRFGFASPSVQSLTANQASRQVSLVYKVNQLRVNIASNQGTDAEIDSLKAVVSYGSTSVEVGDGETIKIPSATNVTITYPEVGGYKCPSSETINVASGLTTKSVTYQTEVVNVTVNAENGSVAGQVLTIGNVKHTLDANGVVTQKVAFGTSYTISLNAKSGYTTPTSITRTAQSTSYNATMKYTWAIETVIVSLSADNGASVIGQKVTINGTTHTWNGTAITQKIAYGTAYEVSVNSKVGYSTPNKQSYVASEVTRNIYFVYNEVAPGVYIESTDGSLYTSEQWDGSKTVNAIVIKTESVARRINRSFESSTNYGFFGSSSDDYRIISDINSLPDFIKNGKQGNYSDASSFLSELLTTYNGKELTDQWVGSYGYSIALDAKNHTFPDGKTKGFLPSIGELHLIQTNLNAVQTALRATGYLSSSHGLSNNIMYSSTPYIEKSDVNVLSLYGEYLHGYSGGSRIYGCTENNGYWIFGLYE